ncbi:MAG: hypothetical protein NZ529_00480 [Cytophagaceae bacterium]|nr:hypothetical protein [Cytophagaceae bacterium]MDW8455240.1 hypothetical protein [Cytophagaceae bacterium]
MLIFLRSFEAFYLGRAPAGPGCPPLCCRSGAPLKLRTGLAGHGSHPSRRFNRNFSG